MLDEITVILGAAEAEAEAIVSAARDRASALIRGLHVGPPRRGEAGDGYDATPDPPPARRPVETGRPREADLRHDLEEIDQRLRRLEASLRAVERGTAGDVPEPWPSRSSRPPPAPEPPPATEGPRLDAARLLATELALGGYTREEISDRLSRLFRIDDPAPLLDEVLG